MSFKNMQIILVLTLLKNEILAKWGGSTTKASRAIGTGW